MKKWLMILGGISIMSVTTSMVISCTPKEDIFYLKTSIGEVIDTFEKKNVLDYYFNTTTIFPDKTSPLVIVFKDVGEKNYGDKTGDIAYWIGHLYRGLGLKPTQEKYKKLKIEDWAWKNAGLWDYTNNKPYEYPPNF
ncbi:hypothetical protein [Williamsoniiplasma luminosum]|uniref:Lipoprotein n=1 Tax=Williamsoniiplasma luminosum TaxID=214888 RepID=A0A2S0NJ65_9MOLU|nr:hypothetical protein [Williamsoniiplasma luminosum]AVP49057.1 MAG: hypothetical protein C5T88_00455 [Williamsoniiplasma luminosum]